MMLKNFINTIFNQKLFTQKDHLLIAVSGGVDSIVLCELCKCAGFNFSMAHCNFKLRGEESERDEAFVKNAAAKYDVPFFVKKFETEKYATENKKSIQVSARELRYNWFNSLISNETALQYILTAHHADDNIETVLMNFFKGTGINGLKGIAQKKEKLIRPLLPFFKNEIVAFANKKNLSFVEDSSNAFDKYTRNYFRNQLIPSIEKVFPKVKENIKDNIERFNEVEILYNQSIYNHLKKLQEHKGNEIHIPVLKLQKTIPLATIVFEIIKPYNFSSHQTKDVIDLLKSDSGKYIQSATHRIIKNRNWLIISSSKTEESSHILIEQKDKNIFFDLGELQIKQLLPSTFSEKNTANIAQIDFDNIQFPLLLRRYKQGDYFYPLGMTKKKKLSRFFIDQKLSLTQKENIWIIESNKKIVWVVGMRLDNRFKITEQTKNIFCINYILK